MDQLSGDDAARPEEDAPFPLEELSALALASDPDQVIDTDALPFLVHDGSQGGLLPQWYMPVAMLRIGHGWRKWLIAGLVLTLLGIEASGLCATFGQLVVG